MFTPNKVENEILARPPYFKNMDDLFDNCLDCNGECVSSCPENIIKIGKDNLPFLDFKSGGCTYCDECVKGCSKKILKLEYKSNIKVSFQINEANCLSHNQTICFSCKESCPSNAINFKGLFKAQINNDLCTNCGFCFGVCPSNAIYKV